MLLPTKSVGVMGDERTYERCVVLEYPQNFHIYFMANRTKKQEKIWAKRIIEL